MNHDFFLMNKLVSDITSNPIDYISRTSIDDDVVLYFMDFIKWMPSFNPAKSENMVGLCYHGVTMIYKDGAIILNKILNGVVLILQCAPDTFLLTGNDLIPDGDDYANSKFLCFKYLLIQKINELIEMTISVINSKESLYIFHSGV